MRQKRHKKEYDPSARQEKYHKPEVKEKVLKRQKESYKPLLRQQKYHKPEVKEKELKRKGRFPKYAMVGNTCK